MAAPVVNLGPARQIKNHYFVLSLVWCVWLSAGTLFGQMLSKVRQRSRPENELCREAMFVLQLCRGFCCKHGSSKGPVQDGETRQCQQTSNVLCERLEKHFITYNLKYTFVSKKSGLHWLHWDSKCSCAILWERRMKKLLSANVSKYLLHFQNKKKRKM